MKVFCINFKKFLSILVIIIICFIAITSSHFVISSEVFKTDKLLPIYSVDTDKPQVSITFDCAWGNEDIKDILSTLKENNVKATFFMVGKWAEKYPESVKEISQNNHDIANHSYTHAHLSTLSKDEIIKEINQANETFKNITGKDCNLFRAPYGEYNDNVILAGNEANQYTIQWSIDSLDWKGLSETEITNRVISKLHNGAIILFHNDTQSTFKALPTIIQKIKEAGYEIVPTSELILKDNYYIDHTGKQISN